MNTITKYDDTVDEIEAEYEKQYNLYHGMRSKKSAEQIKREGFCAYNTNIDIKRNVINSLKFFGKEQVLSSSGRTGQLVRFHLHKDSPLNRRNIWATTRKDIATDYALTSPEHVSMILQNVGIPKENIVRYLREKQGSNCHVIKLKLTSLGPNINFNTGLNCVSPHFIDSIETFTCAHKKRNKR